MDTAQFRAIHDYVPNLRSIWTSVSPSVWLAWLLHFQESLLSDFLQEDFRRPIGDGPEAQLQDSELSMNAGDLGRGEGASQVSRSNMLPSLRPWATWTP